MGTRDDQRDARCPNTHQAVVTARVSEQNGLVTRRRVYSIDGLLDLRDHVIGLEIVQALPEEIDIHHVRADRRHAARFPVHDLAADELELARHVRGHGGIIMISVSRTFSRTRNRELRNGFEKWAEEMISEISDGHAAFIDRVFGLHVQQNHEFSGTNHAACGRVGC